MKKKDRYVDAVHATRAAIESGIVPGGGCALLHASRGLKHLKGDNFGQDVGISILEMACKAPITKIIENAGKNAGLVIDNLMKHHKGHRGYDAMNDKYVDMLEKGIIDPLKVVKSAIVESTSVAGLMITTQAVVVDQKKDDTDEEY